MSVLQIKYYTQHYVNKLKILGKMDKSLKKYKVIQEQVVNKLVANKTIKEISSAILINLLQ